MIYKVPSCSECPFLSDKIKCMLDEKREMDEDMLDDLPEDCVLKTEGLTFIADDDYEEEDNDDEESEEK